MMTLLVVLLGMMAGLAWFLPDDKAREKNDPADPFNNETTTPNV